MPLHWIGPCCTLSTLHTACSIAIFVTHLMTATGSPHDGTKAPMLAAASAHGEDAAAAVAAAHEEDAALAASAVMPMALPAVAMAAAVMPMARPAVAMAVLEGPLRIAIIGGGIGGLGAAICLQRAGEGRRGVGRYRSCHTGMPAEGG